MRCHACAKINWTLEILGRRADGYHDLSMVMQTISLHDTLDLEPAPDTSLTVTGGGSDVPGDERNIALRAVRLMREVTGYPGGVRIRLEKRIPSQAGLGGGSADAAAVLLSLNRLWGAGLDQSGLEALGLRLGADVPFCLRGGLCRVEGIGERLTPLPHAREWPLIVLQPCSGLSTGAVFGAWRASSEGAAPETETLLRAFASDDPRLLPRHPGNALEAVSRSMRPEIGAAVDDLLAAGAVCAQMSGSGSAVFGVFADGDAQASAMRRIRPRHPGACCCKTLVSACNPG